jgi:hypothetical protein
MGGRGGGREGGRDGCRDGGREAGRVGVRRVASERVLVFACKT